MTSIDWLDLISSDKRLFEQKWHFDYFASGFTAIRNEKGQCPICAWAELQGGRSHWLTYWKGALRELWGHVLEIEEAADIADAADVSLAEAERMAPSVVFARRFLLTMFNLQEPTTTKEQR